MLSKAQRIRAHTLRTLNGKGYSYHCPLLFLSLYKNPNPSLSSFAVICSKKIAKHAVDRNKLRRQVYGVLGLLVPTIKPGYICVFTLKKSICGAEQDVRFEAIQTSVLFVLNDAHLV